MDITTRPERRTKKGLVTSLINPAWTAGRIDDRGGWFAEAVVEGLLLQLSKLDGEGAWIIDGAFSEGSFPMWANGYGARYLLTKTLRGDLGEQLDAAIEPEDPNCPCGGHADRGHRDDCPAVTL